MKTCMTMTMNANASLSLDALQIVFQHASDLFSMREAGRVSIASKNTLKIVDDSGVWKRMWNRAVAIGREYEIYRFPRGVPSDMKANYNLMSFNGESGLLPFFVEPDQRILDNVGDKHAAGCLLSKHCLCCGKMAATANPFTMTRVCYWCYQRDEEEFAICKSKAKEAFLLGENDLRELVSMSLAVPLLTGAVGTSVMYLMKDVKEASFAKYGGAEGLAHEFEVRTATAMAKYNKSQSTAKPQKKRPKITKMSHRPADNLSYLKACWLPIQIGVSFVPPRGNDVKMTHHSECHMCDVRGSPLEVMRHERFDHGHYFPIGSLREENVGTAPVGLIDLSALQLPHEVTQLLARAESTYATYENKSMIRYPSDGFMSSEDIRFFDVQFQGNHCKVSVDFYCSKPAGLVQNRIGSGNAIVLIQMAPNTAPTVLLSLGILLSSDETNEANLETFQSAIAALGLNDTSPAQLLAAFMSRAMTFRCFNKDVLGRNFRLQEDFSPFPILSEAYDIWLAAEGEEATTESSDDESELSFDY